MALARLSETKGWLEFHIRRVRVERVEWHVRISSRMLRATKLAGGTVVVLLVAYSIVMALR